MELLESSEFVDVDGDGKYLLQTIKEGKAGGAMVRETGQQHQLMVVNLFLFLLGFLMDCPWSICSCFCPCPQRSSQFDTS